MENGRNLYQNQRQMALSVQSNWCGWIDFRYLVTKEADTQAAYAFLKRLHKQFGEPRVIVTDKAPSIGSAFRKLQRNGLYTKTEHRTVKYLNNLIEQDHRPIKRRNKFYRSLRTASTTIKGMETIRGIYKKNRRNGTLFGFSVSTEIKILMGISA